MTGNVEPQEVEALMGLLGADASKPARVSERDFDQPLRLGQKALDRIARASEETLLDLTNGLRREFQQELELALTGVREVHADAINAQLEDPLAALRFVANGQPGWIVWEIKAAVETIEGLLCGSTAHSEPRALSDLEGGLLLRALKGVATDFATTLGLTATDFTVVPSTSTFGSWRDAVEAADPHRLCFDLEVRQGEASSELRVYLPGFRPTHGPAEGIGELPQHLNEVDVEVAALLGEAEVPLGERLALEEGDVIPLGVPTGGTLSLAVDNLEVARAHLGTSEGCFAVVLAKQGSGSDGAASDGDEDDG